MTPKGLMTLALLGFASFVGRLILERDYGHWAPLVARAITRVAAALLPADSRDRWREEWLAEVSAASEVGAAGLAFAAGLVFVAVPRLTIQRLRSRARDGGVILLFVYGFMLFVPLGVVGMRIDAIGGARAVAAMVVFAMLLAFGHLHSGPLTRRAISALGAAATLAALWGWQSVAAVVLVVVSVHVMISAFVAMDEWVEREFGSTALRATFLLRLWITYWVVGSSSFHVSVYRSLLWVAVPALFTMLLPVLADIPWRQIVRSSTHAAIATMGSYGVASTVLDAPPIATLVAAATVGVLIWVWSWIRDGRRARMDLGLLILGARSARQTKQDVSAGGDVETKRRPT